MQICRNCHAHRHTSVLLEAKENKGHLEATQQTVHESISPTPGATKQSTDDSIAPLEGPHNGAWLSLYPYP